VADEIVDQHFDFILNREVAGRPEAVVQEGKHQNHEQHQTDHAFVAGVGESARNVRLFRDLQVVIDFLLFVAFVFVKLELRSVCLFVEFDETQQSDHADDADDFGGSRSSPGGPARFAHGVDRRTGATRVLGIPAQSYQLQRVQRRRNLLPDPADVGNN